MLRHRPECIDVSLDDAGWVDIDTLLLAMRKHNKRMTYAELHQVVAQCDKQRYALNEDGTRIRASQGHSVPVALGYVTQTPPPQLYHGTSRQYVGPIMKGGLRKMNRHHVHLSANLDTATRVGARRGKPVIFVVDCDAMERDGHLFHCSSNGVGWWTRWPPST